MPKQEIPEIPPPEKMEESLRNLRYRVDIPQSKLAEEIGVSPSQISKIENNCERAKYGDIYEILTVLAEEAGGDTQPIIEWLNKKRQSRSDEYRLRYLEPNDTIREAKKIISDLDISQLPVIDSGECIGAIRASEIVSAAVDDDDKVSEHMSSRIREEGADLPVSEVRRRFSSGSIDAVLVRGNETDRDTIGDTRYVGILTPADFADPDGE